MNAFFLPEFVDTVVADFVFVIVAVNGAEFGVEGAGIIFDPVVT